MGYYFQVMSYNIVNNSELWIWYYMKLNEAVSIRLAELLNERNMTQYQLYTRSGVAKSTVNNIINQTYPSVNLRILHELCQGLGIGLNEFFQTPLFDDDNLDP